MKRYLITILLGMLLMVSATANNVRVTDPKIKNGMEFHDYPEIGLRVTWENSWRCQPGHAPHNWDAVWIFAKYKRSDDNVWRHLSIKESKKGDDSENKVAADKMGVMVFRKDAGYGTFTDTLTIVWDRVVDIIPADRPKIAAEICVYAIEMVYVPQAAFFLGDGTNGTDLTGKGLTYGVLSKVGTPIQPYQVTSEAAVTIGGTGTISVRNFYATNTYQTLTANYPKGFADFYCMKTEISQGQYCAFLNKLTEAQLAPDNINKLYSSLSLELNDEPLQKKYGNTITKNDQGIYEVGDPYRACNFLTSRKVLAYLCWAGLRPMTMLEYEKACRGPVTPRRNEFAWGRAEGTNFAAEKFAGSDESEIYERTSDKKAPNYHIRLIARGGESADASPGRVGAFAKSTTNRVEAGASYYGILDLTGNVAELVVTEHHNGAYNYQGRVFHGNGWPLVDPQGNARWPAYWPTIGSVTYATGYGHRGGHFMSVPAAGNVNGLYNDPSMGEVSYLSRKCGNGSGTTNSITYVHYYDYSYGVDAAGTLNATTIANTRFLHGYGGRGVRNF